MKKQSSRGKKAAAGQSGTTRPGSNSYGKTQAAGGGGSPSGEGSPAAGGQTARRHSPSLPGRQTVASAGNLVSRAAGNISFVGSEDRRRQGRSPM